MPVNQGFFEIINHFILKPVTKYYGLGKMAVHCHATRYSDRPLAALRNWLLCIPLPYIKCSRFACSQAAGEFLYKKPLLLDRPFYLLPNAIDTRSITYNPSIREAYRKNMAMDGYFVLGHIGRFTPQKNHFFLLNFFAQIHKKIPRTKLVLIGDGPLKNEIHNLARKLEIEESILYLGTRDDVINILQAIDIFVLPSKYEGLPVSCYEAMATGLPIIVSDSISSEVMLTSELHRLSLSRMDDWVQICLEYYQSFLNRTLKRMPPRNIPDIQSEAQNLTFFYETGIFSIENIS